MTTKFCYATIKLAHDVLKFFGEQIKSMEKELISDKMSKRIIEVTEEMATKDGAHTVNVRRVLEKLGVTNRVFYNRFHNIDEVLQIIYKKAVLKMQKSMKTEFDSSVDFFDYIMDIAVQTLINTYDIKMQFSQYMFEHDSLTESNRLWWSGEIKKLIDYGKKKNLIRDIDPDMLSYSVWCFCHGFNADAVGRKLSKETAIEYFKFGFGCFLDGLKLK